VQHRTVLVQRHDAGVRQFGVDLAGGSEIGLVDTQLALTHAECLFGGAMGAGADATGFTHQFQLVRGLVGAVVVQVVHYRRRIVDLDPADGGGRLTDYCALALGQFGDGLFGGTHDHDLEGINPIAAGRGRHHVPVVAGLQENQPGLVPGRMHDPASGCTDQRQPVLELRADRIGVVHVVEKLDPRHARGNQQVIEAALCECAIRVFADRGEMLGVEGCELVVHGESCVEGPCDTDMLGCRRECEGRRLCRDQAAHMRGTGPGEDTS
jgi:hypothetical protein